MPAPLLQPSAAAAAVLHGTFGLREFRAGQDRVVAAAEAGRDALLVAPTGAGKSVAYWVPGLVDGGLTVVVSPLIALMADQVARLRSLGIPAAAINSSIPRAQQTATEALATTGGLRFLYVAPERFATAGFHELVGRLRISRLVVDEAHCISSWGHDFRPDYRRLGAAVEACGRPPVSAFTATATPRVREDIVASLGMRDPAVAVTGFVRPELGLHVLRCRGWSAKLEALTDLLTGSSAEDGRTIVYCGRTRGTEEVAARLRAAGLNAAAYHGGLPAGERARVQSEMAAGRTEVIAATSAFGMGIDLPDIRRVVHTDFPGSLEAYYQEAGRAGRDGARSVCTLLYDPSDRDLQAFFIENAYPDRQVVRAVYRELLREGGWQIDDWGRRLPSLEPPQVRSALELLRRAGALGDDGEVTRLDRAPVDFDQQAVLRENAYARVHQMMDYASSRHCRHGRISEYFGDEMAITRCSSCDNCASPPRRSGRTVDTATVREALRCVERFDGHLGTTRIAAILRGTLDSWARSKRWVQRLPSFGACPTHPADELRELLAELVTMGAIRRSSGERPTLALTPRGRELLAGCSPLTVELPPSGRARR